MATLPDRYGVTATFAFAVLQAVLTVGTHGDYASVQRAVASASPYDTVVVDAGVYHEHVQIDQPLVLVGRPGAVIDGGGKGRVIQVLAPATIRGLTIRASGNDLSREDAGLWIDKADDIVVEGNVFDDVLFGIYVKESRRPRVVDNRVTGKPLAPGRRGDGIRLWYSAGGLVRGNHVRQVRDVVVWFSDSTNVEFNSVVDSRYGLHYMYSNFNRFADNRFERNEVGAFLMYSRHITFERNTFAYSLGSFGKGLGFKDTEEISATSNLIAKNAIGLFLDNSPHSVDVHNNFRDNVVAFNEVAISLLPSVKNNVFSGNSFRGNVQVINVTGGGAGTANVFQGNFWSDYAGLDENHDGLGDTPFVEDRVTDDLLSEREPLQLFRLSAAAFALDALGKLVPLLKPQPLVVDSSPLIEPRQLAWAESHAPPNPPRRAAFGLLGFVAVCLGVLIKTQWGARDRG